MVVFNYLVPALFFNATIQTVLPIGSGSLSTGGALVLGHVLRGTLTSEPGFESQVNGILTNGNDFPTVDPDGLHSRPDFRGVVVTDDNEYLQILFTGIQTITPELGAITSGTGTGDLSFGSFQSVFIVSFRTGAAKYKNLQDSIFVGSETVRSLDKGSFNGGIRISKVYSTKTNVTLA